MVWPEHWQALEIFRAMLTQWRVGFDGRTGLDYNVLPLIFRLFDVKRQAQKARFEELQIMEGAALTALAAVKK